MQKLVIAFSALVAALYFISPSAKGQPQPAPFVILVCNVNDQPYNVDQNYSIYLPNGFYIGQLVAAPTPSGWVVVRNDGVRFTVIGCQ